MTNLAKSAARLGFTVTLFVMAGTLSAYALDNGSGSGSGSNCEQTARDDFNANVNSCNNVLSDLPGQLAQCISDAKGDLDRALASCRSSSAALSHGLGNLTVQGSFGDNSTGNGGGKGGKGGKLNAAKFSGAKLATFN